MAEDTTTDIDDTTTATTGTETGTEETGEWTPPTREEWDAAQKAQRDTAAALKKANGEAAQRRQALKDLEKKHEDDESKAQREATEAAVAALKPVAIRAEARSAFLAAGATADKAAKLLRLLDLTKIDVDGETVTGLDDQVDELKAEFPELFVKPEEKKPERTKPPAVNTKPAKPAAGRELSPGEKVMQGLLGKS